MGALFSLCSADGVICSCLKQAAILSLRYFLDTGPLKQPSPKNKTFCWKPKKKLQAQKLAHSTPPPDFKIGQTANVLILTDDAFLQQWHHFGQMTPLATYRPDMTFVVDWALKANYLSIYLLLILALFPFSYGRPLNPKCNFNTFKNSWFSLLDNTVFEQDTHVQWH